MSLRFKNVNKCVPIKTDFIIYDNVNVEGYNSIPNFSNFILSIPSVGTVGTVSINFADNKTISFNNINDNLDFVTNYINKTAIGSTTIKDLFFNNFVVQTRGSDIIINNNRIFDDNNLSLQINNISSTISGFTFSGVSASNTLEKFNHEIALFSNLEKAEKIRLGSPYRFPDLNYTGLTKKITNLNSIFNKEYDDYIRYDLSNIFSTIFNNNLINSNTIANGLYPFDSKILRINQIQPNITFLDDFELGGDYQDFYNLINAREANTLLDYNGTVNTKLDNVINTSQFTTSYQISISRLVDENDSIILIDDIDTEYIISFNPNSETNEELGFFEYSLGIKNRNIQQIANLVKEGIRYFIENFPSFSSTVYDLDNTFQKISINCFIIGLNVTNDCIIQTQNSANIFVGKFEGDTEIKIVNTTPIALAPSIDYNNKLYVEMDDRVFLENEIDQTPLIQTYLNFFESDLFAINGVGDLRYIKEKFLYKKLGENYDYTLDANQINDYIIKYENDNIFSNEGLKGSNLIIFNYLIDTTSRKMFLFKVGDYEVVREYNRSLNVILFKNKYGTLSQLTFNSKPIINIERSFNVYDNNNLTSNQLFVSSPNAYNIKNDVYRKEIVNYNSNISFSLSTSFSFSEKELIYDLVESDFFVYRQNDSTVNNIILQEYRIENNILTVVFAFVGTDTDKEKLKNSLLK